MRKKILKWLLDVQVSVEAIRRYLGEEPTFEDFRNHISHVFDNVSEEIMWGIIVNYLPELHLEVLALIEEHGA